jgi:hypothetical protein
VKPLVVCACYVLGSVCFAVGSLLNYLWPEGSQ